MPKLLFLYRQSTESTTPPTPEQMKSLGMAWRAWMQKYSSAILPGGDGLKPTGRLVKGTQVSEGPYLQAKEAVFSFALIQAADYDAAVAIARECPGDLKIEIRELAGYA